MTIRFFISVLILGWWYTSAGAADNESAQNCIVEHYTAKIIAKYPHLKSSFTQGLVYDSGFIYESTGLYGQSTLQVYSLDMPVKLRKESLPRRYFAEGLALVGDRLFQLTYQSGTAFVYDRKTLEPVKRFMYQGEGWGLAFDDESLIMSDGSDTLKFLDPETFIITRRLKVSRCGEPLYRLNELEYVSGKIYANIWQTNSIAIIDPENGKVTGEIDLAAVASRYRDDASVDVLNGIAWDVANKRLFVTGKLWPDMYHIELQKDEAHQRNR